MKQSQILHVSVCGTFMRVSGRYCRLVKYSLDSTKRQVEYHYKLKAKSYACKYWDNGAKNPARKLDYITADEWLILN